MSIIELYYFLSSREKQKCYQNSRIFIFSQSKIKKQLKTLLKNYNIFYNEHYRIILFSFKSRETKCFQISSFTSSNKQNEDEKVRPS